MDITTIKLPKGHIHWETHKDAGGKITQIVTSDEMKKRWYLFAVAPDGTLTKIKTGNNPLEVKK